jgi:hypothetical protein
MPIRIEIAEHGLKINWPLLGLKARRSNVLTGWEWAASALFILLGWYAPASLDRDVFALLIWVACIALLIRHSIVMGSILSPASSRLDHALAAGLLFQVEAALVVTLLGFVGILSLRTQLWALALFNVVVSLFRWRTNAAPALNNFSSNVEISLPGAFAVAGVALIAFTWIVTAVNQVRYTVTEADSMWYHLPMVAEWIRSGSIWPKESIALLGRAYPGFRESVLTFLSLPSHHEHLALLGILELPLLGLTIGALASHFSGNQALIVSASSYVITAPVVVSALTTQKNDLSLGIFFGLSVYYVLLTAGSRRKGDAILCGCALGALAATKFSGMIYAGSIPVIIGLLDFAERKLTAAKTIIPFMTWAIMFATALLVGGLWYLRNVISYGNPLYPAEFGVGSWIFLKGPLSRSALASQTLGWNIWPLIKNGRHFVEAFGVLIPLIALGVIALGLAFICAGRTVQLALLPLLLSFFCFIAFLQQPFNLPNFGFVYNMRYLIPWFLISVVAVVAGMNKFVRLEDVIALVLLCGSVSNLASWTHWWWLIVAGVLFSVGVWSWIISRKEWTIALPEPAPVLSACALLGIAALVAIQINAVKATMQYDRDYGYKDSPGDRGWGAISAYVHRNLHDKRIVVHGSIDSFPLYGDRLSNQVYLAENLRSATELISFTRTKNAEYIVTFVPTVGRQGVSEFIYGKSLGGALLEQFPETVSLILEDQGAYLLRFKVLLNDVRP